MDLFELTVPQLIRMLANLDRWLARAADHAAAVGIPHARLLQARLAPDQYPLVRQIQVVTDNAMLLPARLAAREWPSRPDTEATLDELRARIAAASAFLATFARGDFADARDRDIVLPWMQDGQHLRGEDYVIQFALPNFYFHLVTAYSILRHEGVPLGKPDFLGELAIR